MCSFWSKVIKILVFVSVKWCKCLQSNLVERSPCISGHLGSAAISWRSRQFSFYFITWLSGHLPSAASGQQKCLPIVVFWPHKLPVFSYLLSNPRCQMTVCRSFLLDYCTCAYWQSINNVMSIMTMNNCQLRLGEQGRGKGIKGS